MSDYTRLRDEQFYGDEGHAVMSSDVPDDYRMGEAIRRGEESRWSRFVTQIEDRILMSDEPIQDPYDDGDEDL